MIECKGGNIYTGIAVDVAIRYQAHIEGKGARYTRAFPPRRLLGTAPFPDRSSASRAEWSAKQLPRSKKLAYLKEIANAA